MFGSRVLLRPIASVMAVMMMLCSLWSLPAAAAIVGTGDVLSEQRADLDRQDLLNMLERDDVQQTLVDMGVSEDQVRDRIQSLTPTELASFKAQLAEAPAGEGVVGIIVLFLLVFIITDMLCATDIFPFVNCIR
ncbi:MAG: PA2779 family protein [Marinobacter sp.]|nr:PA2779 family protein [Marinobacter sp.]